MICPRCQTPLGARGVERWRCPKCRGSAVGSSQFVRELRRIAPDLVPADEDPPILTDARTQATEALACPACQGPMEPVLLGHIDLDRCYRDRIFWFDDLEHDAVLDVAKLEQGLQIRGVLRALFPD